MYPGNLNYIPNWASMEKNKSFLFAGQINKICCAFSSDIHSPKTCFSKIKGFTFKATPASKPVSEPVDVDEDGQKSGFFDLKGVDQFFKLFLSRAAAISLP